MPEGSGRFGISLDTTKRTALYRLYDEQDELLYVGIAFNLGRRYNQHRKTKAWWPEVVRKEACWYEDRRQAEASECAAIKAERPKYNIAGVENPLRIPPLPRPTRTSPSPEVIHWRTTLRKASRAAIRAAARKERTRAELRAAILEAAELGLGPAEICRVMGHHLSEGHVARVIKGTA